MELKDFISDTLVQIAEGVKSAQSEYKSLGGKVNPSGMKQVNGDVAWGKSIPIHGEASLLCEVKFEVALTSEEKDNNAGGIGVLFGALSIGGKSENQNNVSSITNVRFNIPVCLPQQ